MINQVIAGKMLGDKDSWDEILLISAKIKIYYVEFNYKMAENPE